MRRVEPRIPPLTERSLSYAWNQLLVRAGASSGQTGGSAQCPGVDLIYGDPDDFGHRDDCVVVARCRNSAWRDLLGLPEGSLKRVPIAEALPAASPLPFDDTVPVLFWGRKYERGEVPFAEREGRKKVVFYADVVAATFFMLSRWEEMVAVERDEHGRFPATASVALKQGFLGRPVVDEYGLILGRWLEEIAPGCVARKSRFSVRLSHDIDHVRSSARSIAGEVVRKPGIRSVLSGLRQLCVPSKDRCIRACYELAEISERNGFKSSFYFKASSSGPLDSGYDPNGRAVRRCARELARRGHELGFHPGYGAGEDFDEFLAERDRLRAALGTDACGGRQHYLRFDVRSTWRFWEAAGFSYDSTVGYADHEGFRCGTCRPYAPFSIDEDREYRLLEVPLIVMDTTLRGYRQMRPDEAERTVLALARRCEYVEGPFSVLWHNSSSGGSWESWLEAYRRIVGRLAEMVGSV